MTSPKKCGRGWVQWLTSVIPELWEAKAGVSPDIRSLRPDWPTWWNPISIKNTKISWAWGQAPVIPATREAEAELLEPWRQRLQWAKIAPLHSGLGDRQDSLKKIKKCGRNGTIPFLGTFTILSSAIAQCVSRHNIRQTIHYLPRTYDKQNKKKILVTLA